MKSSRVRFILISSSEMTVRDSNFHPTGVFHVLVLVVALAAAVAELGLCAGGSGFDDGVRPGSPRYGRRYVLGERRPQADRRSVRS